MQGKVNVKGSLNHSMSSNKGYVHNNYHFINIKRALCHA